MDPAVFEVLSLLQLGARGPLSSLVGRLFVTLVVVGVVILVGRLVLRIAWRVVTIAAVVLGLVFLVMLFLPQFL